MACMLNTKSIQAGPLLSLIRDFTMSQVQINKNVQRKNIKFFLNISFNICFGCSKEPSH